MRSNLKEIIGELERRRHPEALEGMARYGIDVTRAYGIAMGCPREIALTDSPTARWVAADALRELMGDAVQGRLRDKARKRARSGFGLPGNPQGKSS